jgi:hypothetical protein
MATWQQAMRSALARTEAGDHVHIIEHMLAPEFVDALVAKHGADTWKQQFRKDKLESIAYYYGWLKRARVATSGSRTVVRGEHGCYATFVLVDGEYLLGDFGQVLSSM